MRKYLLFAAAALIAATASAQKLTKKKNAMPAKSNIVMPAMKSVKVQKEFKASESLSSRKKALMIPDKKLSASSMRGIRYTKTAAAAKIAKAAGIQSQYNANAFSAQDGNVSWTMLSVESEGKRIFGDIIPNKWPSVTEVIAVEATVNGTTVTIPAQFTGLSGTGFNVIIFGNTESDGSIKMTLGDDGSLSLPEGQKIYYGAFTGKEFDPTLATYLGPLDIYSNITYLLPGQIAAPKAAFEPEGLYLHMGISKSRYGYNNNLAMVPAYAPVSFKNFTTGTVTAYDWSMPLLDSSTGEVKETLKGTEQNFTVNTIGGSTYGPASLTAWNETESASYTWGTQNKLYENAFVFAGATAASYVFRDGTESIVTKANPDNDIAYYSFLGTPDVNTQQYSLSELIFYQGKPSAPLYIEGVRYLVKNLTVKENFTLTCQIVKATRNFAGGLTLGDVIAEGTISAEDVTAGEISELAFNNLYVYDEDGMTQPIDHLFIEDEFAVVIKGWDNGTFSCVPYGEYNYNENGLTSTYCKDTGSDKIGSFGNLYTHAYIGFTGAAYGYLYTKDATTFNAPAEGGSTRISIKPMLCSVDQTTQAPKTRLFVEDETSLEDWFDLSFENETYTDTEYKFDLVVNAAPLPEGTTGRSASVRLYQEGAYITLNIVQGDGGTNGINGVTANAGGKDTKTFNIMGQRVAKDAKGIVIRNGKKIINN